MAQKEGVIIYKPNEPTSLSTPTQDLVEIMLSNKSVSTILGFEPKETIAKEVLSAPTFDFASTSLN